MRAKPNEVSEENMICKYYHDEFCTNDQCLMRADYCPVPDNPGVCMYEELVEEPEDNIYVLTPKGCLIAAVQDHLEVDLEVIEAIWYDFSILMRQFGYTKEVD
jgi:hypothetical protein